MPLVTTELKIPVSFEIDMPASSSAATVWITPEEHGAVGDGVVDDTVALNLADASPLPVYLTPGKTYRAAGQLLLGQNSGKRWFSFGTRGGFGNSAATILLEYNGGPCIRVGTAALTNDVVFQNVRFYQNNGSTQPCFEHLHTRGVHYVGCQFENIHEGFRLGTATEGCYINTLSDSEVHMRTGHSHFITVVNCTGQLDIDNSYIEGAYNPGTYGVWFKSSNPSTFDHFIGKGGYLGRFGDNIRVDGRVVNVELAPSFHIEGQVSSGLIMSSSGSGENWNVSAVFGIGLAGSQAVLLAPTQLTQPISGIYLRGLTIQRAFQNAAIEVYSPAGNPIHALVIDGVNIGEGWDNMDNTHAMIECYGVGSGFVNNVFGRNLANMPRFAYVVRSQASGADWRHGSALFGSGTVGYSVRS